MSPRKRGRPRKHGNLPKATTTKTSMVLVDRNTEMLRNGRRSRGPSPNGHGGMADSSSDDDNSIKKNGTKAKTKSEYEEKIRVGRDYQAVCPDFIPHTQRKTELLNDRALLVWSPTKDIADSKLEEYISIAKEKYGYNGEQALGMLFWHKHDLERAVSDLANFTPFPDEWTKEDKILFEQAFQFHRKNFHRIRQMLPDKTISSLVKYYYSWKKSRHRQSLMDRLEKSKAKDCSDNGSENGSNDESEVEAKEQLVSSSQETSTNSDNVGSNNKSKQSNLITTNKRDILQQQKKSATISSTSSATSSSASVPVGCTGCGVLCNVVNNTPYGQLCNSCFHHWRRTGTKRPINGPYFIKRIRERNVQKRKPPRGMHINHDDIVALASSSESQDQLLANLDREKITLMTQVQKYKQTISGHKRKISDMLEGMQVPEQCRINPRWNNEELALAVLGVKKFGKDFQAIAEMLGTKTETHVRTFFVNYRRRFNLDDILKKRDSKQQEEQQKQLDEQQQIEQQHQQQDQQHQRKDQQKEQPDDQSNDMEQGEDEGEEEGKSSSDYSANDANGDIQDHNTLPDCIESVPSKSFSSERSNVQVTI